MREKVIKKIKMQSKGFWSEDSWAICLVMVDHVQHKIEFEQLNHRAPDLSAWLNFVLFDRDVRGELRWALNEFERKHPISFSVHDGMSGARDITFFVHDREHAWVQFHGRKIFNFHVSCEEKLNEGIPDMFSGDLLDLLLNFWDEEERKELELNKLRSKNIKRKHFKFLKFKNKEVEFAETFCGTGDI